jgi:hypothetical protein
MFWLSILQVVESLGHTGVDWRRLSILVAHSPANHSPVALRSTKDATPRQPPPLLPPEPTPCPAKTSPWRGAPTPRRCWRPPGSTTRGSKPPMPPRRARRFLGPAWMTDSPFGGALPHPTLLSPAPSRKVGDHAAAIAASQTASGEVQCVAVFCKRASTPASDGPG